jgi:hypothetical protein
VLDGETVVLGPDGVSDFTALHSGMHNERAQFYAFDMLAGDGEDQRQLALSLRKTNPLGRRPGIFGWRGQACYLVSPVTALRRQATQLC